MTDWEKGIKQEICDGCPADEEYGCSHKEKEEKCMYNLAMENLIKREIKDFGDSVRCSVKFEHRPAGSYVSKFNIDNLYKDRGIK